MPDDIAIRVEGLSKKLCKDLKRTMLYGLCDIGKATLGMRQSTDRLRKHEFWALKDISLEVRRGECLGIIGPNGAGKSTLLKILAGIMGPTQGRVRIGGRLSSLIEIGTGFHPMLSGRENIYINGAVLGMRKREIERKFDQIVEFSGVEEFIDMPVKFYSSGMLVRLGFSVAAHLEPDILLVDEILSVGDAEFQGKCFRRMSEIMSGSGKGIVLVSHHMSHIARMCSRAMYLSRGVAVAGGDCAEVIKAYRSAASGAGDATETGYPKSSYRSDEVALGEVQILDESGRPRHTFQRGESCRIGLALRARETRRDVIVTVSLTSVFDHSLTHYSTKGQVEPLTLDGGCTLWLDLHHLGLASGRWKVSVGVFARDYMKPLLWEWFLSDIDITEPKDETMHGRFRMPHSWTLREAS